MNSAESVVHVIFVLDRSGSMNSIVGDVIGGFNAFIRAQQADPEPCLLTLVQFDSVGPYEVLYDAVPIEQAPTLDSSNFVPRGGTPLYDAMGRAIADAMIRVERHKAAGEPHEQILFVTFTDGEENSSKEYNRSRIFKLIERRQAEGWTFVYLGANQDALAEGSKMGVSRSATLSYEATSEGTQTAFHTLSRSITAFKRKVSSEGAANRADTSEGSFFEEE